MLWLVKQFTVARVVGISQRNAITTGNSKVLHSCMEFIHIMTYVVVVMVDCVMVIVYTLHVWDLLELQLFFIVH